MTAETLRLFASERSAGKTIKTPFGEKTIELFTVESARECDFIFLGMYVCSVCVRVNATVIFIPRLMALTLCAVDVLVVYSHDDDDDAAAAYHIIAVSGSFALEYAPALVKDNGPYVIDNSSAFRYDDDIPLVVSKLPTYLHTYLRSFSLASLLTPYLPTYLPTPRSRRSMPKALVPPASLPIQIVLQPLP